MRRNKCFTLFKNPFCEKFLGALNSDIVINLHLCYNIFNDFMLCEVFYMKRMVASLLSLVLIFSICACEKKSTSTDNSLLDDGGKSSISSSSTESTSSVVQSDLDSTSTSSSSSSSSTPNKSGNSSTSRIPSNSSKPTESDDSDSSNTTPSRKPSSKPDSTPSSTTSSKPESKPKPPREPETLYILGDSYSTFEGCIPDGYVTWYVNGGSVNTDVADKSQTWWHQFITKNNLTLIKNDSYSGTTICNTGYGGNYCPTTSFIGRFDAEVKSGFFNNKERVPDKIIIFGGTNDSWANSPIGSIKWSAFSDEDLKCALPAFCYLVLRIKECLPDAEIIMVINSELKQEITEGYQNICAQKDIKCVTLSGIYKKSGHPTVYGMQQICEQITAVIYGDN